jgi:two-component system OmpR family response regulator
MFGRSIRPSCTMAIVLVVEDERDTRDLLARIVRRAGHAAITAGNGWEALLALDEGPVDLVLLDLMMPGMDGRTFLSILRNDPHRRTTPVVLVTACPEGELLAAAARLGVYRCLKKAHYTPQELLNTIDEAMRSSNAGLRNVRGDLHRPSSQ